MLMGLQIDTAITNLKDVQWCSTIIMTHFQQNSNLSFNILELILEPEKAIFICKE